LVIFHTKY